MHMVTKEWWLSLALIVCGAISGARAEDSADTSDAARADTAEQPGSGAAPPGPSSASASSTVPPPTSVAPPLAQARDDERLDPAPSRGRKRRRVGKMITGISLFAAGYVGSVATYALSSDAFTPALMAPLAGPWVALATTDWETTLIVGGTEGSGKGILMLQGLLQATGFTLAALGIAQYNASKRDTASAPRFMFAASPLRSGGLASARLRF
jgi:hypothetical protein